MLQEDGRKIECLLRNFSENGACIEVDKAQHVPGFFHLNVGYGSYARACRVVWVAKGRVGLSFLQDLLVV